MMNLQFSFIKFSLCYFKVKHFSIFLYSLSNILGISEEIVPDKLMVSLLLVQIRNLEFLWYASSEYEEAYSEPITHLR